MTRLHRPVPCAGLVVALGLAVVPGGALFAQAPPIVLPGAPGEASRLLSADEAVNVADTRYSRADREFLQAMIPHHAQALEMAALAPDRTNTPEIVEAAGRIDASQQDEIEFMQKWLAERGEAVPDPAAGHAMTLMGRMSGMATPAQMTALAAAAGPDFDRLFLELMIRHHEGALEMVEDLLDQPGAAYDPVLFEFTNDVQNDQENEIERMSGLLAGLSADPRVGLAAGFADAGSAISGLRLLAALPKPAGFFVPLNPAGLPPERQEEAADAEDAAAMPEAADAAAHAAMHADPEHAAMHAEHHGEAPTAAAADVAGEAAAGEAADGGADGAQTMGAAAGESSEAEEAGRGRPYSRSPLLNFSNTDMAFAGDVLVTGSYHGFNIYRLDADGIPALISSIVCPGGQGDVSIVAHLLIMSVEQTRGRLDCGLEGVADAISTERFRGIRIFDISDLAQPVQVAAVQTCRGSHTHSIVSGPDADGIIVVYNSGTSSIRDEEELAGCIGAVPGDDRTALFRIDVIEIPLANPAAARIVDSPAVFADPESGVMAGLWRGGDHGDDTQDTRRTDQCHDITVFPATGLAAGACSGNGIIFDISDPMRPARIDAVIDAGFAYWHSATFNNDGTKVLFTDEWGGGGRPRCRAHDPLTWGADAIYDIVDGRLQFQGYFKMPAPQTEEENCVAHNGAIVPVPGRDIFVQAWYQGGLSVIDFTDSANPVEIAFFDRGPLSDESLITAGYWSTYWYGGRIYGTEIARGLDVFELIPGEFLSANEIAAARLAEQGAVFNPQQQFPVSWPDAPVVALALLDQLDRSGALAEGERRALRDDLAQAASVQSAQGSDAALARALGRAASRLARERTDDRQTSGRLALLAGTLEGIAAALR